MSAKMLRTIVLVIAPIHGIGLMTFKNQRQHGLADHHKFTFISICILPVLSSDHLSMKQVRFQADLVVPLCVLRTLHNPPVCWLLGCVGFLLHCLLGSSGGTDTSTHNIEVSSGQVLKIFFTLAPLKASHPNKTSAS